MANQGLKQLYIDEIEDPISPIETKTRILVRRATLDRIRVSFVPECFVARVEPHRNPTNLASYRTAKRIPLPCRSKLICKIVVRPLAKFPKIVADCSYFSGPEWTRTRRRCVPAASGTIAASWTFARNGLQCFLGCSSNECS